MNKVLSTALVESLMQAWDMAIDAARQFSDEDWYEALDERMQPARLAYHLLIAADRYTWLGAADDYPANRQFTLDWVKTPVRDLLPRETAIQQLERAKTKSREWVQHFGAEGLVSEKALWPWTGDSALAQALYHLRHLQHHTAELNVELRRRGLPPAAWR